MRVSIDFIPLFERRTRDCGPRYRGMSTVTPPLGVPLLKPTWRMRWGQTHVASRPEYRVGWSLRLMTRPASIRLRFSRALGLQVLALSLPCASGTVLSEMDPLG